MSEADKLLLDVAALVETGQSSQMSLTVVTGGAVITGRLAPESVWRQKVLVVLTDSDRSGKSSAVFDTPAQNGPPTHLHFHVARSLQGTAGIEETGAMYRVAIEDVSAWTVGRPCRPLGEHCVGRHSASSVPTDARRNSRRF